MRKIEFSGNTVRATWLSLLRGGPVASEGLFDNDARMLGQVCCTESFDHHLKERRRNSEVVRGPPGSTERLLYRRERVRVFIIPTYVFEQGQKMAERAGYRFPPIALCCPSRACANAPDSNLGGRHRLPGPSANLVSPSHRVPGRSSYERDRRSHRRSLARPNGREPSGISFLGGSLFLMTSLALP